MRFMVHMAIMSGFLFLTACGGGGGKTEGQTPAEQTKTPTPSKAQKDLEACGLMDAAMVDSVFGLTEGSAQPGETAGMSNSCAFAWPKPNKEEIAAANQKAMMAYMTASREAREKGEEPPKMKIISEDAEVFFNFTPLATSEAAEGALKANVENLRKGVTAESQGQSATFTINYDVEVQNVGNQAVWSSNRHQLMTQEKNMLLYLTVKVAGEPEADLEKAKTLMNQIIQRL